MRDERTDRSEDPGVPEALPRTLVRVRNELGVETMDRIWVFPPIRRGRKESGLVVASLHLDEDAGRRRLVTVSYTAERRGLDLTVESNVTEEGAAPPDMLPRVMEGVVRRAGEDHTDAREVAIEREPERYEELLGEFDATLFEPVAKTEEEVTEPAAKKPEEAMDPVAKVGERATSADGPPSENVAGGPGGETPAGAPEPEPMEAEIP